LDEKSMCVCQATDNIANGNGTHSTVALHASILPSKHSDTPEVNPYRKRVDDEGEQEQRQSKVCMDVARSKIISRKVRIERKERRIRIVRYIRQRRTERSTRPISMPLTLRAWRLCKHIHHRCGAPDQVQHVPSPLAGCVEEGLAVAELAVGGIHSVAPSPSLVKSPGRCAMNSTWHSNTAISEAKASSRWAAHWTQAVCRPSVWSYRIELSAAQSRL